MKLWNRLRRSASQLLASDEGARQQGDEAIFLTQTARHNHQPQPASAPQVRQRYFGLGLRRKSRDEARAGSVWPKLPGRLRLWPGPCVAGEEQSYFGTVVQGTPRPALKSQSAVNTPVMQPRREEPPPSTEASALLDSLFGKTPPPAPVEKQVLTTRPARKSQKQAPKKRRKMDRGDVAIATLGVLLGVTCALFPWYIFFNQEKFGVREFTFNGRATTRPTSGIPYVPPYVGKPFASAELPKMELDFFPTATLPSPQEPARAIPASQQPFPADHVRFKLVHVANGRAMIEDDDGLWVVQRGSRLPDTSHVAAIERRDGHWVLVTTADTVIELAR